MVALALVAALGGLRSFDPFAGDQALFTVGALKLHAGGVLYRDFWDLKQPGIFGFYLVAGSLFGFSQTGIHAFEVVWQCAFGVALFLGLRRAVRNAEFAAAAILIVPGAYYAGTSGWHLTQVEALVGLPLFLCSWAAVAMLDSTGVPARNAFLSGFAAGIVALLKLVLFPVALAAVAAVAFAGRLGPERRDAIALAPWWLLGLAIPLAAFAAYVLAFGITHDVIETFFALPSHIVAGGRAPLDRLVKSAIWFGRHFGWLAALAVAGEAIGTRSEAKPWRRAAYAWLALGILAIVVQTQSWWEYQFLLLLPPLGILATLGLDALGRVWSERIAGSRWQYVFATGAFVAATPALALVHEASNTATRVLHARPFASESALETYHANQSHDYVLAQDSASFLSGEPGGSAAIYVCGNPLVYLLAHREQAAAINGWALELYPPDWWRRLIAQVQRARPVDIFVSDEYASLIATRAPDLARMLMSEYTRAARLPDGTWYRLTTLRRSP